MENSNLEILCGDSIPTKEWANFVSAHPQGTVFHTPEMYSLYKQTSHNNPIAIAVVETIGERLIVRGLLLANVISNGSAVMAPFTTRSIVLGGALVDEGPDQSTVWKLIWAQYCKKKPWYVIYTEIRPIYDMSTYDALLVSVGFKRTGHFNLMMDVSGGKDVMWEKMHKERRRNVNHAINSGMSFCEIEDMSELEKAVGLIRQTYRRKNVPLTDKELFLHAKSFLGPYAHWFAAYLEGKMIACQIRLCYKELVYAWYAASDDTFFKQRPNDFLTWHVLCWANEHGYGVFDFGGGGEPGKPYGVRDYKLKYGCEIHDYGRYMNVHNPILFRVGKLGVKVLKLKK